MIYFHFSVWFRPQWGLTVFGFMGKWLTFAWVYNQSCSFVFSLVSFFLSDCFYATKLPGGLLPGIERSSLPVTNELSLVTHSKTASPRTLHVLNICQDAGCKDWMWLDYLSSRAQKPGHRKEKKTTAKNINGGEKKSWDFGEKIVKKSQFILAFIVLTSSILAKISLCRLKWCICDIVCPDCPHLFVSF